MEITNPKHFKNRAEFRKWLGKNHAKKSELWLLFYKVKTGKKCVRYPEAVEEALCFGWIDSTAKRIDQTYYAQRFTPRNPKSKYSEANKQRLRELVKKGMVIPSVKEKLADILSEEFPIPSDILDKIKANKKAWENFQQFSSDYQRIRIAFIEGARNRPEEFEKRLGYFIKMTEKNKQFGFGGIQKYY